jgi:hypothetical protein
MRKVVNRRVRDTAELECVCGRDGEPSRCYSTYSYLLHDPRDQTWYVWRGNHWAGLGPDSLEGVEDPLELCEEEGYELSAEQTARLEALTTGAP